MKGMAMKTVVRISFLAVSLGMLGCETGEDLEGEESGLNPEARSTGIYNTIEECEAQYHKGDGWKSLCDKHGGWGNPNAPASGRTCKKVDCERNVEHDVSAYFFPPGCYCKDGYKGPDPDEGLEPLPPGCKDAMAGKITFCQKSEICRGTGTRTVNGYSCRDVNQGFGPLVCSGMFSDKQWKQMRLDCCYSASDSCPSDPQKTAPGVCGCGTPDSDSDRDGTPDCKDECPSDPKKTQKSACGCGKPEGTCGTCVDRLSYCKSFI
jgi:hypothetical protein